MHLDFSYEDIPKILSHLLYLYNPCLKCVVDEFHCQELDVVQAYPEAGYCARLDTLEARLNEEFTEFRQPQNFPIPDTIIDTPEYQWERRKKRNQIRFKNGIIKLYGASRMEGIPAAVSTVGHFDCRLFNCVRYGAPSGRSMMYHAISKNRE